MIELEYSKMAPTIASLLQAKGTALPTVQWLDNQIASAKKTLDTSDDAQLFSPSTLKNESMAAAVRASVPVERLDRRSVNVRPRRSAEGIAFRPRAQ